MPSQHSHSKERDFGTWGENQFHEFRNKNSFLHGKTRNIFIQIEKKTHSHYIQILHSQIFM